MNLDNKGTFEESPRHDHPVRVGLGEGQPWGLERSWAAGAHGPGDEQQRQPGGLLGGETSGQDGEGV